LEGGEVSGAVINPAKGEAAHLAAADDPLFEAFRVLEPALRRFIANRVRNDADVEDVLQDLAARIIGRDREAPVENKTAFLFSIASNLMRDRDRRRLVRRQGDHVALEDVEIADPAALQEQIVDSRQRLQRFMAALKTLPGKEREVFLLHKVEGQTLLQAAERTGLSMAQVRKLVEQAMARLARKVWKD
jgi:RNA polymerase sigma factor (sigma-70 family)